MQVDSELRRATIEVLRERGWAGLTLERVAEVAGRSRSTLWRQGLTRELLVDALIGELAADFRTVMYPILTSGGKVWIGSDGEGLYAFDPASNKFFRHRHASNDPATISDDHVSVLFEDRPVPRTPVRSRPPTHCVPSLSHQGKKD